MVKVVLDASVLARLNNPDGPVEVCDESGTTVGYFQPVGPPCERGSLGSQSPFSDEEMERRRQQRSGRSLEEILADLQKR